MSKVSVEIAGRNYLLNCAEGEEAHITMLAASISSKVDGMKGLSEARTLLFAALLLADEQHEAQKSGSAPVQQSTGQDSGSIDPKIAEPLENLAEKLEALATRLEA